jgi:hypothetical protein
MDYTSWVIESMAGAGSWLSLMVEDNSMKSARRPIDGARRLAAVFSKQNEGLSRGERESRLLALERIANAVRARRSVAKRDI